MLAVKSKNDFFRQHRHMKIAIIGAGAMGGAIVDGLVKGNTVSNDDIFVSNPTQKTLDKWNGTGVNLTTDNTKAAKEADLVTVVVKPWLVEKVLEEIKPSMDYTKQMLAVVAAGISSAQIKEWMDKGNGETIPLFLIIPNIAIAEKSSMTFIVPIGTSEKQTAEVKAVYDELGSTLITEERLLVAGTTLASCGIAYAMRYVRAATEGGVEIGFRANDAKRIVLQTVKGAVDLLFANGNHPEAEIDKVTTPGGVTIKGLNEMEHAGFTSAVIRGLKAGCKA